MPKNKDLKRIVRTRMKKSGESYTAARRQVLAKRVEDKSRPARFELAGMTDAAVRAKTGRDWKKWVAVLDAAGAAELLHRDIVRTVHASSEISGWWAQMVATGYERIRGLRDVGQRRTGARGGTYDASKSRTFPVSVAALRRAFRHAPTRARWLTDTTLTIRRTTSSRTVRATLGSGGVVAMWFMAKGRGKSSVQIQQSGLPSKAATEAAKRAWGARLDALAMILRQ